VKQLGIFAGDRESLLQAAEEPAWLPLLRQELRLKEQAILLAMHKRETATASNHTPKAQQTHEPL